jgi:hypothetical protein
VRGHPAHGHVPAGAFRWARLRGRPACEDALTAQDPLTAARRDLAVAIALFASWVAVWGLYSTYTWTEPPFGTTLQFARFYVPALGAIALLGAWLITRIPRRQTRPARSGLAAIALIAIMFGIGIPSFHAMLTGGPVEMRGRPCVIAHYRLGSGSHVVVSRARGKPHCGTPVSGPVGPASGGPGQSGPGAQGPPGPG